MTTVNQNVKRDDITAPEGETLDTTMKIETEAEAEDTFPVMGRIAVAKSPDARERQGGFNLMVLDLEGVTFLENFTRANPDYGFTNDNGETWVNVTIDEPGRAKIRQAGRTGASKIVIEGVLTIVDSTNGRGDGFMRVTGARPASANNGGRVTTKQSQPTQERAAAAMPNLGFRGRRGA